MKILYRPHCGGLKESMDKLRVFRSVEELKTHVSDYWNEPCPSISFISKDDIVIGEVIGSDPRIGWNEVRYVLTKRFGNDRFDETPQAIGYCEIIEE